MPGTTQTEAPPRKRRPLPPEAYRHRAPPRLYLRPLGHEPDGITLSDFARIALARASKRRIKTQCVLPTAETAAMLFWALMASGQINMRRLAGTRHDAGRGSP